MATKKRAAKKSTVTTSRERVGAAKPKGPIKLAPVDTRAVSMTVTCKTALIQHRWSEKALREIREKHAGKKTKNRDVHDPEQEGRDALYLTEEGLYGVPAMAIKKAVLSAAHRDIGIEKTLVRKALFLECKDRNGVLAMDCSNPVFTEDAVRVNGKTDLRYRAYFYQWSVDIIWTMDATLLQLETLVSLVDRAGFGVGIGEWRPENDGEFGRFEVDTTKPIDDRPC